MPRITTNPGILAAARRAIEQLLQFKGQTVVIYPKNPTPTQKPGGGADYGPGQPYPPQTISLAQIGGDNLIDAETDGQAMVTRNYILTGRHDMLVEVDSFWVDTDVVYHIESVDKTSGFKTSCDVVGHVSVPNG